MAWRASRAGTARRRARIFFPWRSIACSSKKSSRSLDPALDARDRLFLLLHDAPEYVIGDMISPFKVVIGDAYKSVESRILDAILRRFSLSAAQDPELLLLCKKADRASAFFEAVRLAGFTQREAERIFGRPATKANFDADVEPIPVETAQQRYIERFRSLEIQAGLSGAQADR